MRFPFILMLILFPGVVFAQQLNGVVIDKATATPVAYATISSGYTVVSATANGSFSLPHIRPGDTILVTNMGYKPYKSAFKAGMGDTITIYLQQLSIMLRGVTVRGTRDYKMDSIRNRKEFAPAFGYKKPTFKDMFITQDFQKYVPYNYITAPHNTTEMVSVNALSLLSLFSKNKNSTSKLQQTLLKDEDRNYVDRAFSKQKITLVTNLKGDSLVDFIDDYRPTSQQVKSMTDYELISYIKKSYEQFVKIYDPKNRSPFAK